MKHEHRIVYGGVDTHQDIHVAAVIDEVGTLLATKSFPTSALGLKSLQRWLTGHGRVVKVGVGHRHLRTGLQRVLQDAGLEVVEVNRPNRQLRRAKGKSDTVDAESAARAVLAGHATAVPKSHDGIVKRSGWWVAHLPTGPAKVDGRIRLDDPAAGAASRVHRRAPRPRRIAARLDQALTTPRTTATNCTTDLGATPPLHRPPLSAFALGTLPLYRGFCRIVVQRSLYATETERYDGSASHEEQPRPDCHHRLLHQQKVHTVNRGCDNIPELPVHTANRGCDIFPAPCSHRQPRAWQAGRASLDQGRPWFGGSGRLTPWPKQEARSLLSGERASFGVATCRSSDRAAQIRRGPG